ncbi:MAG: hypothetical protein GF330_05460 [Candidatus Eisenbacteria bacterium]|nr:hypothetical protein [Candidatus Eisenbacteria bacterium]
MRQLTWEDFPEFREKAAATICRQCRCGFERPWRSGPPCQGAWMRYRASGGTILDCSESLATHPFARPEEGLMSVPAPAARTRAEGA